MDIKIEKNIPLAPMVTKPKQNKWENVLEKMEIGDSFVIPHESKTRGTIFNAAKNRGMKVVTRKIAEDTIRVWRVK